ncbi:hypothetical protein XENTR_v10024408 [Xenopus tropicalis]|nr:hypothetical protein XENTR_v10024408 [Xenopus tropicalis]
MIGKSDSSVELQRDCHYFTSEEIPLPPDKRHFTAGRGSATQGHGKRMHYLLLHRNALLNTYFSFPSQQPVLVSLRLCSNRKGDLPGSQRLLSRDRKHNVKECVPCHLPPH